MMTRLDIEKEAEWILAENLEEMQRKVRDEDINNLDVRGDFGSYRALNCGRCDSGIEMHNATGLSASNYARTLSHISQLYGLSPKKIADIGCGGGFIASMVKDYFRGSSIHAYDISKDAIEYGEKTFPSISFFSKAITVGMKFDCKYDLVYVNEFYPFTRTASNQIYNGYISTLLDAVSDNGILVISMLKKDKSLINGMDQIKNNLMITSDIKEIIIPLPKIYKYFPLFKLAQVLTIVANRVFGREDYVAIVFSHK